jgi:flavodoxin
MKALIVYESKYGNTEKIALAISSGMKEVGMTDVVVKKTDDAASEDFKSADIWVVGGPTHIMSATGGPKSALKTGIKSGLVGKKATFFDTRFKNAKSGGAEKLKSMAEKEGLRLAVEPEAFIVTSTQGPLAEGEEAKAAQFGRKIAGALRS